MTSITFETADGTQHPIETTDGTTLMQAALDNDIDAIVAECGGACSCATCHCYLDPNFTDYVPAMGEIENAMLDCVPERQPNSRLSCQIMITPELEGMVIKLPESQY